MNEQHTPKRFGEKLRILRTKRTLSIIQLAHSLGYSSHGYMSELETGRKLPTIELVIKIARLFQVTTDSLLLDELELPDEPTD